MTATGNLTPMPVRHRPVRRLVQLYLGLLLYSTALALMVRARLGLAPWDVFHQGLARRTGLTIGWVLILVGVLVLLLWIPLRQRPGIGTVSNAIVIGLGVDGTLAVLPTPHSLGARCAFLVGGILGSGVASGLYIGARLGSGPRDGLMTGYAARGHSTRVVRTGIEVTVLIAGWLLGGTVGVATLLFAVTIGPLAHVFIPLFSVDSPSPAEQAPASVELSIVDTALAASDPQPWRSLAVRRVRRPGAAR
jgi:uncharacterized membrane protein YczE